MLDARFSHLYFCQTYTCCSSVLAAIADLLVTFGGYYVCANFCENRSRNSTVRVRTDGMTRTGFYRAA